MTSDAAAKFVLLVLLVALSGAQKPPATQPLPLARLDALYDPTTLTLLVELRNIGRSPIKMDKDLVLALHIEAINEDGSATRFESGPEPVDAPVKNADRFVTLQPGEYVIRTIHLREGFRVFVWGHGTMLEDMRHIPFGYERTQRLPVGARPARIDVAYEVRGFQQDSLQVYLGQDIKELGPYQGPLKKTADISRSPASRPATTRAAAG